MSIQSTFNQGLTLAALLGGKALASYGETRSKLKSLDTEEKTLMKELEQVDIVKRLAEIEEQRFDIKPTAENLNRVENAREGAFDPSFYDTAEKAASRQFLREGIARTRERTEAFKQEQARIAESNRIRNLILGGGSDGK